jgi:hypothetical protein
LVGYYVPVISLCTFDGETCAIDDFVCGRIRMSGGDNSTVGGHRFNERDSEPLASARRSEDVHSAHMIKHVIVVIEEVGKFDAVYVSR